MLERGRTTFRDITLRNIRASHSPEIHVKVRIETTSPASPASPVDFHAVLLSPLAGWLDLLWLILA